MDNYEVLSNEKVTYEKWFLYNLKQVNFYLQIFQGTIGIIVSYLSFRRVLFLFFCFMPSFENYGNVICVKS